MRLNKFISENSDLSRRKADIAISNGRVSINGTVASLGTAVNLNDEVSLDGKKLLNVKHEIITVLLNKPVGYVCSKDGQGSKTVYDLLPEKYAKLNIAGRLDKDSSGLVVLTNDGTLHNELTHPSKNKEKIYKITIDKNLWPEDFKKLKNGVDIGDERPSKFKDTSRVSEKNYIITMNEGRNRQIRRTFEALGYEVKELCRTQLGKYKLAKLALGEHRREG